MIRYIHKMLPITEVDINGSLTGGGIRLKRRMKGCGLNIQADVGFPVEVTEMSSKS